MLENTGAGPSFPNKISNRAAAPSLSLRSLQGQGGELDLASSTHGDKNPRPVAKDVTRGGWAHQRGEYNLGLSFERGRELTGGAPLLALFEKGPAGQPAVLDFALSGGCPTSCFETEESSPLCDAGP